jgi:hypothetical protein
MKLKVYVIDLEIPARTKRRALLVGIPLGVLLGGAAIVWAGVPNVFSAGQTLSSAAINQNFSSLDTRITTLEGAPAAPPQAVWAWEDATANIAPTANKVASMTFTPPAAGFALVTAHYGTVVLNDNGAAPEGDCRVASQLSLTAGQLPTDTLPGYQDIYINGNLPTEINGGTYLDFDQSTSVVIPVTAAATTVYLNGAINPAGSTTGCQQAYWRSITLTAVYSQTNPAATGTTY